MSLTQEDQLNALCLREEGLTVEEIAKRLRLGIQPVRSFFHAILYAHHGNSAKKMTADSEGELDFYQFDRKEEALRAADLWERRMNGARWDVQRREGQG